MTPESNLISEKPIKSEYFPDLLFVVKSSSIKFSGYDFKNIPVSTGRADVIARFILAAISEPSGLNDSIGVWLFLNDNFFHELSEYLIANGKKSDYEGKLLSLEPFSVLITSQSKFFKAHEASGKSYFTEYDVISGLYHSFEQIQNVDFEYSLFYKILLGDFSNQLANLVKTNRKCYILEENAEIDLLKNNIFNNREKNDVHEKNGKYAFIIGDQKGFPEDFEQIKDLFTKLSVGKESQLASTVVSLIKFKILTHAQF